MYVCIYISSRSMHVTSMTHTYKKKRKKRSASNWANCALFFASFIRDNAQRNTKWNTSILIILSLSGVIIIRMLCHTQQKRLAPSLYAKLYRAFEFLYTIRVFYLLSYTFTILSILLNNSIYVNKTILYIYSEF